MNRKHVCVALAGVLAASLLTTLPGTGVAHASNTERDDARAESAVPEPAAARALFERLKGLSGEWRGRSTKGWEETTTYRTIAAGSVVMATSFDAHPDETMVTMFALDGDRLQLIHYCVAGNQPELEATQIASDGLSATFTFTGGGNLPTRDRGHMDQAVFRFVSDERVTSQWTWYQDGEERWMEEIEYQRLR
ncbi:MAG: hypothetical protein ACKVU1_03285 [bacterium]